MKMHDVAARGFQGAGNVYEQGRPDYPLDAIAHLVDVLRITRGTRGLDLGAGTGKLTRLLVPTGAQLLAIEPVEGLRQKFVRILPHLWLAGGLAEAIPLRDGTVDVVVAGTSFHWFDGPMALREIHRVLRPHGRLGLIWNDRDETVDWVAQLVATAGRYMRGDPPRYARGTWRNAFTATSLFAPLDERRFPFVHPGDKAAVLARVASTSFIAALPPDERQCALRDVEALLDTHPATRGHASIDFPYRADVFWCTQRESG